MKTCIYLITIVFLTGCQTSANYQNSSVIEYLYPKSRGQEVSASIPMLSLPLRVGVAFTPGGYGESLTEASKQTLLEMVAADFRKLEFVDSIAVIPSAYLRPAGSFENLSQLKRMFNVDVIALVSYDQTRFTDEGLASIAYWTIVGAYLVPGEKNTTHTLLDAVLYDIDSQKLLFRAPGTSSVKSNATPINLQEQVRRDSVQGFELAGVDLASNLNLQLEMFRKRIKESPGEVQVAERAGYRGSGSSGWFLLLLSLVIALRARRW